MSALFDRMAELFERGHRRGVPDLLSDERFDIAERTAKAAVLIAITDRPKQAGGPGLILTQRPTTMRDHPGQVAFPGGKLDAGETAERAALREAYEELSLDPAAVRLIGATDGYRTGTGFDITPIVGIVPPDLPLVPHPREVEDWFEIPLGLVLDQSQWSQHNVFWRGEKRHYLEMHYEGFRVWGVTAAIIYNLSKRINAKELLDD